MSSTVSRSFKELPCRCRFTSHVDQHCAVLHASPGNSFVVLCSEPERGRQGADASHGEWGAFRYPYRINLIELSLIPPANRVVTLLRVPLSCCLTDAMFTHVCVEVAPIPDPRTTATRQQPNEGTWSKRTAVLLTAVRRHAETSCVDVMRCWPLLHGLGLEWTCQRLCILVTDASCIRQVSIEYIASRDSYVNIVLAMNTCATRCSPPSRLQKCVEERERGHTVNNAVVGSACVWPTLLHAGTCRL